MPDKIFNYNHKEKSGFEIALYFCLIFIYDNIFGAKVGYYQISPVYKGQEHGGDHNGKGYIRAYHAGQHIGGELHSEHAVYHRQRQREGKEYGRVG